MRVISPIPEEPQPSFFDTLKQKAMQAWNNYANPAPIKINFAQPTATPSPTPIQTAQPSRQAYQQAIEKGFENWGSPPAATLSGTYAQAPETAEIFRKYPFLLPAQSLAETSGGAKQAVSNNPQNWGLYAQRSGNYNPSSPVQVVQDAMSAIGGTRSAETANPDQMRTQGYYQDFRNSGDLHDFAKNYAPPTENDTEKYVRDLISIMSVFENALGRPLTSGR